MDAEEPERVGYKKPPTRSRFRKGQSGNPRGRPKGAGMRSSIEKVLERQVTATVDGETRKMPLTEALALQLVQKALKGDLAANRELMRVMAQMGIADPKEKESLTPSVIKVEWITPGDCNPALRYLTVITDIDGEYKIEPWVIEAAKARGVVLDPKDQILVSNCTRKPGEKESNRTRPLPHRKDRV